MSSLEEVDVNERREAEENPSLNSRHNENNNNNLSLPPILLDTTKSATTSSFILSMRSTASRVVYRDFLNPYYM